MNSLVIALSGKMGVGKSTVAAGIAEILSRRKVNVVILSFGEEVKKEAAELYGFDVALCSTPEGKNTEVLVNGASRTVRWCLQTHGHGQRIEDPLYWVKRTMKSAKEASAAGANVIIIDDVRYLSELEAIRQLPHHLLFRLFPYEGYRVAEAIASHVSETELDGYNLKNFSRVFVPLWGKLGSTITECCARTKEYLAAYPQLGKGLPDTPQSFEDVPAAIAYFQKRDNVSRNAIAKHLGMRQRDFLPLEKGEELLTMEQASALAELFDVSVNYFLVGSDVEETEEEV